MKKSIVFIFLFSLFFFGCKKNQSTQPEPMMYSVKYEVIGSAKKVTVTYLTADGGIEQKTHVIIPWTYKFPFQVEEGTDVSISATNETSSGDIIVTIYRDGEVFKQAHSSGGYVTAMAQGTL